MLRNSQNIHIKTLIRILLEPSQNDISIPNHENLFLCCKYCCWQQFKFQFSFILLNALKLLDMHRNSQNLHLRFKKKNVWKVRIIFDSKLWKPLFVCCTILDFSISFHPSQSLRPSSTPLGVLSVWLCVFCNSNYGGHVRDGKVSFFEVLCRDDLWWYQREMPRWQCGHRASRLQRVFCVGGFGLTLSSELTLCWELTCGHGQNLHKRTLILMLWLLVCSDPTS